MEEIHLNGNALAMAIEAAGKRQMAQRDWFGRKGN